MLTKDDFRKFGCRASMNWAMYHKVGFDIDKLRLKLSYEDIAVLNYVIKNKLNK